MRAQVCVSNISFLMDKEFSYEIPPEYENKIDVGTKVIIPFGKGNRKREGVVTHIFDDEYTMPLKRIIGIANVESFVTYDNIELARYISERYYAPLYDCVNLMIMPGSSIKFKKTVSVSKDAVITEENLKNPVFKYVYENKKADYSSLEKLFKKTALEKSIDFLLDKKLIEITERNDSHEIPKISVCKLIADRNELDKFYTLYGKKAKAQSRLLQIIEEYGEIPVTDLIAFSGSTRSSINGLKEKGLIDIELCEVKKEIFEEEKKIIYKKPVLNDEQKNAVKTILDMRSDGEFHEFLIKGVTGSGKTEVYLELCEHIINENKTAIILVPEIALTPQIRQRFFNRFGSLVAVLHSALSVSERKEEWRKIKNGEVKIAVGARSAVFAPFSDLSMIIIDEEHETTYKSENSPRYDAKDVASYLMKKNKGTLILSSATPSVVNYYRALNNETTLINLNKRYNENPLPYVSIVDMKEELKSGNHGVLSEELVNKLEEVRDENKKAILLLNRRGYSTFVNCRDCGYVVKCKKCDIALTYHNTDGNLKCHYCGAVEPVPFVCPECKRSSIKYFGTGTQRLEEELYRIFPESKIIRMDNDTTNTKMSHERLLKRFKNESPAILIGTQMIAKGLDFKDVSLVGVVAADSTLFVGGYFGNEKTFSLITQVCGRAGRGDTRGYAVVQTYQPEHYSIIASKTQDYEKFYENEIIFRKKVKYPPFCDLINIVFTGNEEQKIFEFADSIKKLMTVSVDKYDERKYYISMYGPSPCTVAKIRDKYRFHILIKCTKSEKIKKSLFEALSLLMKKAPSDITLSVDVNPVNFI